MPSLPRRLASSPALLLVASIVVPVLLGAFAVWHDYQEIFRGAERTAEQNAVFLGGHADEAFETLDLILAQVNEGVRGLSWDEIATSPDVHRLLLELHREHRQVDTILLTDRNGIARASSIALPLDPLDVSDRPYFRQQRIHDRGFYIGAPMVGRRSHRIEFAVSRRRTTPDGRFDGTVSLTVFPEYFQRFYGGVVNSPHDAVALYRRDGTLLARYPGASLLRPPLDPDDPVLTASALAASGVLEHRSEIDGVDRIVAFKDSAAYPILALYGVDRGSVLRLWAANLIPYGGSAALATLALISLAAISVRRARREAATSRRLDEELRRGREMQAALVEAEKMKSVGQMTGGIAHDFNNLLTVISGNLELIAMAPGKPERVARLAAMASKAAERGERLIQQLLMFSRRQVLRPETISPNRLLRDVSALIRRALGDGIRFELRLDPALGSTRLDPAQFEAAILNLAMNARDAVRDGGAVTVETSNVRLGPGSGVPLAPGPYLLVTVEDNGTGIDSATLSRVFEPFFTTKEPGKGSGLGLSQVYGFAQEFGGCVRIDSTPGSGTKVSLYLPRVRPLEAPAPGDEAGMPDAAASGGETVLVVDDDREVLDIAVENLGELGYRVFAARDGEEALALLRGGERLDLLFTDVAMPGGINGEQLAREARQLRPALRVLLTSGYPASVLNDRHDLPDDLEILAKPYRRDDLAAAIRRALAG